MRKLVLIACSGISLLLSLSLHAQGANASDAESVEVALSDEALELRYGAPTTLGGQPDSEVSYALFLSEERDLVGSASLLLGTDLGLGGLSVQFGPQAYAALLNEENNDAFALAVGAQVRYELVPSRDIALVGNAFWSPDVLTFGQADNITDFMVRGEMSLGARIAGFVGYRWFQMDLRDREDVDLENELFAGIKWRLH